jgi:hypothetical protein
VESSGWRLDNDHDDHKSQQIDWKEMGELLYGLVVETRGCEPRMVVLEEW